MFILQLALSAVILGGTQNQPNQPKMHPVQLETTVSPSEQFPGRYIACEKPDDGFRPYIQRFSLKEVCNPGARPKSRSSTKCMIISIKPNATIGAPYDTILKKGKRIELYDLVQEGVGIRLAVPRCN
jgi:hypothetical protein